MAAEPVPRPQHETGRSIVVAAVGIMQILSWGSTFYLLPVLGKPIVEDTGWAYDWVMGGLALGLLVAGIVSPRVGRAIGRGGGRVLAYGSASIAAGLVVIAIASRFGIYVIGWVLIGAGMGAALYDAAFATLGALYGKSARSAITSVTLFGGFASTVCWPLSAFLMAHVGWRGTCLAYAAMHIVLGFTLALFVLPERRPDPSKATDERGPDTAHLTGDEHSLFLVLAIVLTISAAILSLVGSQLITLLLASGLDLSKAVALGMLIGPSAVGARFVEALAGGRYHPIWTMVASTILVGCGALLFLVGPVAFGPAIAIYAAGNGIGSIAKGTLPLALFGPSRYPALAGRIGLSVMFAMSLAPYAGALTFQLAGAGATLSLLLGLAATNVVLVSVLLALTRSRRLQ
jgi:MFS family permease